MATGLEGGGTAIEGARERRGRAAEGGSEGAQQWSRRVRRSTVGLYRQPHTALLRQTPLQPAIQTLPSTSQKQCWHPSVPRHAIQCKCTTSERECWHRDTSAVPCRKCSRQQGPRCVRVWACYSTRKEISALPIVIPSSKLVSGAIDAIIDRVQEPRSASRSAWPSPSGCCCSSWSLQMPREWPRRRTHSLKPSS